MIDLLTCWWETSSPRTEGTEQAMGYCLPVVPCTSFTFKCSSKVCIGKENPECDGIVDCSNGFDEHNCGEYCFAACDCRPALFYITQTLQCNPPTSHGLSWAPRCTLGVWAGPLWSRSYLVCRSL